MRLPALALAYVQNLGLLAVAMLATGVAWISILSALQVSAQMTLARMGACARTGRLRRRVHGRHGHWAASCGGRSRRGSAFPPR